MAKRHYLLPPGDVKFIATEERGKFDSHKWKFCYSCRGKPISPWHSIPLFTDPYERKICHFVLEMPRGTQEKIGISQKEEWNNLKHEVKDQKLVTLTHGKIPWNYGSLPQTWQDPRDSHWESRAPGDDGLLDFIDIGAKTPKRGAVYTVKPLGCLLVVNEGKTDWKIVGIAMDDPKAAELNDIDDVDKVYPGLLDQIREWYRVYKVADGKEPNKLGFNGRFLDQEQTYLAIGQCWIHWNRLFGREGRSLYEHRFSLAQ
jgi:inorganic pyrophosphatase